MLVKVPLSLNPTFLPQKYLWFCNKTKQNKKKRGFENSWVYCKPPHLNVIGKTANKSCVYVASQ